VKWSIEKGDDRLEKLKGQLAVEKEFEAGDISECGILRL
jgi:hypothetical protein